MPFTGRSHLGREAELEHAQRRLDAARAGDGGVVVVRGPSGTGTTRFAYEVAARADRHEMLVLWGRCMEGLSGRPFEGLAEALEEYGTGLAPHELETQLGAGAPPLARLAPGLRTVLPGIPPPTPLDAADERARLEDAVMGWLGRAAGDRPLLLVVDDVQWADEDLRHLLRRLIGWSSRAPVLVLATESLGQGNKAGDWPDADVIDLPGLDPTAIAALLAQDVAQTLPPSLIERITDTAGGVPLHARHVLRHLIEQTGRSAQGRAAHSSDVVESEPNLPPTFGALVGARMSRLSPEARLLVNALACCAVGTSAPVLAAICRLSRSRTAEALDEVTAAGLARAVDGGESHVIDHDLLRRVVVARMPPATRVDLHARAAAALEAEYGDRSRQHAGRLADHVHAARADDEAAGGVRHCLVAAEQARAAGAYRRSALALAMAADVAETADRQLHVQVLARQAAAEAEAGGYGSALRLATGAVEGAARASGALTEAVTGSIETLRICRSEPSLPEELVALSDELRRKTMVLAPRAGDTERRRLEALAEKWLPAGGGSFASLHWSDSAPDAVEYLVQRGDPVDLAAVLATPRPRAREETLRALGVARRARRPQTVLHALRASVLDMATRHGLFREGAGWAGQYLAAAERYGSLRDEAMALVLMARCDAAVGRFDRARRAIDAATAIVARLENDIYLERECFLAELALAHYRDGAWQALADATGAGEGTVHGLLMGAERVLAWGRIGRHEEAHAALPALIDAVAELPPLTLYRDSALLAAVAACWELGSAEHTLAARTLIEAARAGGVGTQVAGSLNLAQARLLALAGDVEGARELFERERPALEESGLQPLLAMCDYDEAVCLAAAGPAGFGAAAALLRKAGDNFARLGMDGWQARARSLLDGGFEAASLPGGRLHFRYPGDLSRREADVVRLVAAGASLDETASTLRLDADTAQRHLAAAVEKLGGSDPSEAPRLARRHGLGGGV